MSIDWAATGQMVSGLGAWAGACAVVYAAWLGSRTFVAWRDQELTRRRMDQAQAILVAVYSARRALQIIRKPEWMSDELFAAEREFDEKFGHKIRHDLSKKEKNHILDGYIHENRVKKFYDVQRDMGAIAPIAQAMFGEEVSKGIELLQGIFYTIEVVARGDVGSDEGLVRWQSQILNDLGDDEVFPNETTRRIAEAVKVIESACLPILK